MKIAFVSLYNNFVIGCRAVGAYLKMSGHEVRFIHIKAQYRPLIPYHDLTRLHEIKAENPLVGVTNFEEGYICTPIHIPITQTEEEIFLEELRRDTPDIVGFGVLWSELRFFRRFADLIRARFPHIRIVVGGVPATTLPRTLFSHADVVCIGEGEESMAEWLRDVTRTDVAGLWFKENGTTIENPPRPLIEDLDALPIPLYGEDEVLIEEDTLSRKLETDLDYLHWKWIFMSTRGCPMACSYCCEGYFNRRFGRKGKLARRSVDHFIAEIKEATRRLPYSRIQIWDSIFLRDEEWLEEFTEKYKSEIALPFEANGYPGISTRRAMELAREAGADEVKISLQTGTEKTLKRYYQRFTTPDTVRRSIIDGFEAGMERISCDLLIFSPYDTEESLAQTFDFLSDLPRPVTLFLNQLVRYPGTPIAEIEPAGVPLDEKVHRFWNTLFLLTQFRDINPRRLQAMSRDAGLREHPEILEEFLSCFAKRRTYVGKPLRERYTNPNPAPAEVGRWPKARLEAQKRFPYAYARWMLRKRQRQRRPAHHVMEGTGKETLRLQA